MGYGRPAPGAFDVSLFVPSLAPSPHLTHHHADLDPKFVEIVQGLEGDQ